MSNTPNLSLDAIRSTLSTNRLGQRIDLYQQVGSTNREAMSLAQAGCEHGTVVVADTQTEGRGRLARVWFSPPGVNLYCSIVLRMPIEPPQLSPWLSWLPLITAVAVAEAIESATSAAVSVKWPNDLLIGDRKVGGILCESGTGQDGHHVQVIGIGLNINGQHADFPSDLGTSATTIREATGTPTDRNRLLAQLLHELEVCIEHFSQIGTAAVILAYQRRCSTLGKPIRAALNGGTELVGLATSLGEDGSLTVVEQAPLQANRQPTTHSLRVADIIHLRT